MASRIIAQLLLSGGAMVIRAAAQAYQQALANGQRAGGAEALKKAAGRSGISLDEARQILGIDAGTAWEVVEKKYQHLYKANTKTSHYLLSKVYRAKERIDEEHPDEAQQWRERHGDPTDAAHRTAQAAAAAKAEADAEATGGGDGSSRNT
eukprot:jgi/Ulvmu1/1139/UM107_0013.1